MYRYRKVTTPSRNNGQRDWTVFTSNKYIYNLEAKEKTKKLQRYRKTISVTEEGDGLRSHDSRAGVGKLLAQGPPLGTGEKLATIKRQSHDTIVHVPDRKSLIGCPLWPTQVKWYRFGPQ